MVLSVAIDASLFEARGFSRTPKLQKTSFIETKLQFLEFHFMDVSMEPNTSTNITCLCGKLFTVAVTGIGYRH